MRSREVHISTAALSIVQTCRLLIYLNTLCVVLVKDYYKLEVGLAQNEMYKNGPIVTSMAIYEDFYTYKSGTVQSSRFITRIFYSRTYKL